MTTDARKPRFFALIPCAGSGSRAGIANPKQYQLLAGQAMIWHTLQAFRALPDLAGLYVVVAPEGDALMQACPDFGQGHEVMTATGGATRAASVYSGLETLLRGPAEADDWVLVHDAARCLVTSQQIMTLINTCQNDEVGGLLALPVPDTLKSSEAGRVAATVDRSGKYLAQTPQMFRIGALLAALAAAEVKGLAVTDESSAIEAQGLRPLLVSGGAQNFKVTYPEDFALAEAILRSRMKVSP